MNFNNDSRMMPDNKRRAALRKMKAVDGKIVSYEKFLKDYLRSMSFLYKESGYKHTKIARRGEKYKRLMTLCESMAKTQWDSLPFMEKEYG